MITYGHEKYIQRAIEGVLMQECDFNVELIIADDNSPDQTNRIVQQLKERHQNGVWIHYTKHQKNKGMMSNFVWALSQCKGDYIALCDGDDYWTDVLKLQKQVSFLEKNKEFVLCFHPCYFLKVDSTLKKQSLHTMDYEYTIKNILSNSRIPSASLVYRRSEAPNKFPSWFYEIASGDVALIMMLFEKGKFKLLDDYMSVYRLHNHGVSRLHANTKMVHYRAVLYSHLNTYFEYKYEKEIYEALYEVTIKYMPYLRPAFPDYTFGELIRKVWGKFLKRVYLK